MQALLFISVGAGALTLVLFLWLFRQVANPSPSGHGDPVRDPARPELHLRGHVSQQDEIGQTLTAVNRLLDTFAADLHRVSVGSLQIKSTAESLPRRPSTWRSRRVRPTTPPALSPPGGGGDEREHHGHLPAHPGDQPHHQ